IGISTATTVGASGAASTAAKRGTTRSRTSALGCAPGCAPAGRTNTATQPARQPSTPASHWSGELLSITPMLARRVQAREGATAPQGSDMSIRPRRSVLYMPGSNARAIEKARTLAADGIILDLEDAVAPDAKAAARKQVADAAAAGGFGP